MGTDRQGRDCHSSLPSFVNQRSESWFGSFRDAYDVAWKYFWPVGNEVLLRIFFGISYKTVNLTFTPHVIIPLFKLVST